MNKYKRYIPIIAVILIALGVNLDQFGIDLHALSKGSTQSVSQLDSSRSDSVDTKSEQNSSRASEEYPKWTKTDPNINQWHIFRGEINRSGKPVGFHSRPNGQDPSDARVSAIRDAPNRAGVYTANIEIRDGNEWKSKFSSFFPDSLSRHEVLQVVLHAYKNSDNPRAQPFEGPSGLGFSIQGYTSNKGGINTAFPVYVRSQ